MFFFFVLFLFFHSFASTPNEWLWWTQRHNAFINVAMRRRCWQCWICCFAILLSTPHTILWHWRCLVRSLSCVCELCVESSRVESALSTSLHFMLATCTSHSTRTCHCRKLSTKLSRSCLFVCLCEWNEQCCRRRRRRRRRRRQRLEMWAIKITNNNENNNYTKTFFCCLPLPLLSHSCQRCRVFRKWFAKFQTRCYNFLLPLFGRVWHIK